MMRSVEQRRGKKTDREELKITEEVKKLRVDMRLRRWR